jgi:pimeloyl-ACP methyl ester carboxylesterase
MLQTWSIALPEVLCHDFGGIPISRGHALAAKLTGGALTPVPGSGHLMQDDAPEAIVAAMFNP